MSFPTKLDRAYWSVAASGEKVHTVMSEYKSGSLRSSSGKKVKSRKQAVAIALSEERRTKKDIPVAKHPGHSDQDVHGDKGRGRERNTGKDVATALGAYLGVNIAAVSLATYIGLKDQDKRLQQILDRDFGPGKVKASDFKRAYRKVQRENRRMPKDVQTVEARRVAHGKTRATVTDLGRVPKKLPPRALPAGRGFRKSMDEVDVLKHPGHKDQSSHGNETRKKGWQPTEAEKRHILAEERAVAQGKHYTEARVNQNGEKGSKLAAGAAAAVGVGAVGTLAATRLRKPKGRPDSGVGGTPKRPTPKSPQSAHPPGERMTNSAENPKVRTNGHKKPPPGTSFARAKGFRAGGPGNFAARAVRKEDPFGSDWGPVAKHPGHPDQGVHDKKGGKGKGGKDGGDGKLSRAAVGVGALAVGGAGLAVAHKVKDPNDVVQSSKKFRADMKDVADGKKAASDVKTPFHQQVERKAQKRIKREARSAKVKSVVTRVKGIRKEDTGISVPLRATPSPSDQLTSLLGLLKNITAKPVATVRITPRPATSAKKPASSSGGKKSQPKVEGKGKAQVKGKARPVAVSRPDAKHGKLPVVSPRKTLVQAQGKK